MLATCFEFLHAFQPPEVGGGGSAPDAGGGGGAPPGCGGVENIGLLVVMMLVFYFLLIRPQQRQQKQRDTMLKALQKGALVRTSGGIRGEIISLEDHEATLLVAPKVKINVLRQNIAGLVTADDAVPGPGPFRSVRGKTDEAAESPSEKKAVEKKAAEKKAKDDEA